MGIPMLYVCDPNVSHMQTMESLMFINDEFRTTLEGGDLYLNAEAKCGLI